MTRRLYVTIFGEDFFENVIICLYSGFFTIVTLPSILELLKDIARMPDRYAPVSAVTSKPSPQQRSKSKSPAASVSSPLAPLPSTVPAAAAAAAVSVNSKTNLILLFHRDLVKLDHIFDRERVAVAPVLGADPSYTGLGLERKTARLLDAE